MEKSKYFTKYLPVEGEIKAGDRFLQVNTGRIIKHHPKNGILLQPQSFDKLIKLFLCSRDIQVGDKVYMHRYRQEGVVAKFGKGAGFWLEGNEQLFKNLKGKGNWGKVIGEVSLEATWVKEDDEFDESEVEVVLKEKYECLCKVSGQYRSKAQKSCEHMVDDHRGGDFCFRKIEVPYYYRIKGSCGHFH